MLLNRMSKLLVAKEHIFFSSHHGRQSSSPSGKKKNSRLVTVASVWKNINNFLSNLNDSVAKKTKRICNSFGTCLGSAIRIEMLQLQGEMTSCKAWALQLQHIEDNGDGKKWIKWEYQHSSSLSGNRNHFLEQKRANENITTTNPSCWKNPGVS